MNREVHEIQNDQDINNLRQKLREVSQQFEFSEYEVTKLVTASSEIARNVLNYTSGGHVCWDVEESDKKATVEVEFEDEGPGIDDLDRAMEDGFRGEDSSGLGVGLPGARRLADGFEIASDPERGTKVTIRIESTD